MNMRHLLNVLPILAIATILYTGCTGGSSDDGEGSASKRAGVNEVIVHELADPDMLIPVNSTGASSTYIQEQIFQTLLEINPKTYELTGLLAVDRPTIELLTDGEFAGGMKLEYVIRPEATWDNGTPITGYDYLSTIKSILNPKTDCEPLKPYFDWVGDIVVDEADPKKIIIYSKTTYMLIEEFSGYWVLPEYIYDPEQIMRKFSIRDLNSAEKRAELKGNPDIIKFAENYNSEKYQREKGFVVGSGPYTFEGWETGQRITLKRKENWWGDKLAGTPGFAAYPEKITYQIINDLTTAVTAMKDEGIDLMRSIKPKDFIELKENTAFTSKFNLTAPTMFSYYYLGLNTKNPKLEDVRVRKAISHAVNKKQIIDVIYYGLAVPTTGPVHPSKPNYNKNIVDYDFDLEKSKALLDEAGWKDTNGDGIRDKNINGEQVPLVLEFKYNTGNDIRKNIGLLFKEDAKKIGIDVNIVAKEWSVYLDELDHHEFEISCAAWVTGPLIGDPKQIWHTESSVDGGSNYVSFGNAESDALIDAMRMEYDEDKRIEMSKRFQEIVHEQAPYVFLFTPTERIAIHNRFEAETYAARPGYKIGEFKLKTTSTQANQE